MNKMPAVNISKQLLSANDPEPVEIINTDSDHAVLLVCEHAGQIIPEALGDLGINQVALDSHIGWDIGAEKVTRNMAMMLGAPAVIQRYSRLVIDCNRPVEAEDAIPEISDSVPIPGNQHINVSARASRITEIFEPYQNAIETFLSNRPRRIVLSIHSFTRSMDGQIRPWEIGFLFRKDKDTSNQLAQFIKEMHPELTVGMNQPYQIDDESDWFVPQHGEASGISHSLIEIRNDQIDTTERQEYWAKNLVHIVERYLREA